MQIIIPMSGIGKRFIDAGYKTPKPFIVVDGKPIIEHVVNLFPGEQIPGEQNFIFVCNKQHTSIKKYKKILEKIAPHSKIISIDQHKKGPVFAVSQIFDLIDDNDEVIVNYCDFSTYWDYKEFLEQTRSRSADGAIAAYKNFHPHMLGTTNYAFIKEEQQILTDIKEKEPFTNNRMQEYASNGTYYFKNGSLVKKYFTELMEKDISINGEYYVSLVYKLMAQDGLRTSIYEIQHMLQWGTPQDLEEYQQWSNLFSQLVKKRKKAFYKGTMLIPAAGKGSRFSCAGYVKPKPLIEVSGKPMVVQAASSLPCHEKEIFILHQDHCKKSTIIDDINKYYPSARCVTINHHTQGQACTCEIGLKNLSLDQPLLIGACDNGALWNEDTYQKLILNPDVDAIVWTTKNHFSSKKNPHMYGWVKVDKHNNAIDVSVKKPVSNNLEQDHVIIGTFYFKKADFFLQALQNIYKKNNRVNNEFYVDSCMKELIEMGLRVKVFEVDHYICWGTPNDLKTFEYWQRFFHKCQWHPYSQELDCMFDHNATCVNFVQTASHAI